MNKKTIYLLLFVSGIFLLFYGSRAVNTISVYISIAGVVLVMYSLFKISTVWVKRNDEEEKNTE
ncbi:hypothetical protein [Abyssalbus ytuae]|uniref:Uncharacterized protein n=1 Tax=Abyssalbus ytuae TaxID=2926907 RepID=A0A9E6ZST2_9FLAO|nr:hypothetical protein [Abyssalbus ytuae]UOB18198.1 hypothetical protein MQE35_02605 [Abyssalbus ytuae]